MTIFNPMKNKDAYIASKFLVSIPLIAIFGMLFSAPVLSANYKEGRILVQPRAGLSDQALENIIKPHGGKSIRKLPQLNIKIIEVPVQAEDAVARALSKNKDISFAEKDMAVEISEFIPNDPQYSSAWHLPNMNLNSAWDITRGEGITVAILDSGVDAAHPDLASQMVSGWNVVSNNTETSDVNGHGTAVAGVVAAATNNNLAVASVAWNASLMPVRVTNQSDGWTYWSDIAEGVIWAVDHGADVANISYEISASDTITSAAQYMRNKGGVVVASAGNDNTDLGRSDNPYIITVAATDRGDVKASFSNYGALVDVTAPGNYIMTTKRGGSTGYWWGTSFSAPATAGVVALIMAANPDLTPDEVEAVLEDSADDLVSGYDWHAYFGHGRVNAGSAALMAMNTVSVEPIDTTAPNVTIFSPADNLTVSGLVNVEVAADDDFGVREVSLYADNQLVGVDTTEPYQFSWDSTTSGDGTTVFTAYAVDQSDNESVPSEVSVQVKNIPDVDDITAPVISISNPEDGSNVKRTVSIRVSAYDDIMLKSIELYIDNVLKMSSTDNTLAYSWNTRKASDGPHIIEAIATDTNGNSSQYTINVSTGDSTTTTTTTTTSEKPGKGNAKKK